MWAGNAHSFRINMPTNQTLIRKHSPETIYVAIRQYCIYICLWGLYLGLCIVLMGVCVLYVWATDGGLRLLWQHRVIIAGDSRRTGGGPCGDR